MGRTVKELFREAVELPDGDQRGTDPEVEAAWAEEVERRIRQVDAGQVEMIPWEQVRAELFGASE